jgi:uncharacterized membrane protein
MRKWYPWSLVAAATAFSLAVYNRLPERVPTHWGLHGEVNGWSNRAFAAFLMPILMAVIAAVLPRLPKIDPRGANFAKFRPTYDLVVNAIIAMVGVMHVSMLGAALGWPISMERVTPVMVGGLFILLGNVMPRARPNWWFGIRTPWTLSNDRVWERTHRLGGYMFVGAGLLLILVSVLPPAIALPIIIVAVVTAAVVPLVYSYFAWKQETSQ